MSQPAPDVDPRGMAPGERRWRYRRSLASRVILLTTIAVGLSVTFVSVGAFITVRLQLKHSLDNSLVQRAESASEQLRVVSSLEATDNGSAVLLASADVRIGFVDPAGNVNFLDHRTDITLGAAEAAVATGRSPQSLRTVRADGIDYRVVTVPTSFPGTGLVLAQSLKPQEDLLAKLGLVSLFFGMAGIIAAGVAGWAVARSGLRPVRQLTAAVEGIARTEDLTPLPVEGDDEVARLATAFNQVLTSLAASRDRQRRLVADAGHELRTPLTSLRTNIELLTQVTTSELGISPEARAELLDDLRAQIEELTTLVGDLVELARDDPAGHVVSTVDLAEVVETALARVRRRAPTVEFRARAEPWYVEGETAAVERAVTNLLDNAAKWSPTGGVVEVVLEAGELVVDDQGPGIAAADLPHVFERFYRSSESRAMPGSGLGLSIVAQVVERHSGSVTAGRSPAGGARLVLRLPGSALPKPTRPPAQAAAPDVLVGGRRL